MHCCAGRRGFPFWYLEERRSGRSATRDPGRGESAGAGGERERRRRRRRAAAAAEEEARWFGPVVGVTAARRMGKTSRSKEADASPPLLLLLFFFLAPSGFSIPGVSRRLVAASGEAVRRRDCGNVKGSCPCCPFGGG